MSTDYEPGTVAVATVCGVDGVRVMRTENGDWRSAVRVHETGIVHDDSDVTDIRPLVVLDLSDQPVEGDRTGRNEPTLLVSMLRETAENFFTPDAAALASKVADQIEAQQKPPRIPEPNTYGVVNAGHPQKDGARSNFVRIVDEGDGRRWVDETYEADLSTWDDLIDPTLVREGVER